MRGKWSKDSVILEMQRAFLGGFVSRDLGTGVRVQEWRVMSSVVVQSNQRKWGNGFNRCFIR